MGVNNIIYKFCKRFKLFHFLYWLIKDMLYIAKNGRPFSEYGLTVYCGRQGYGKTVAMTEYLVRMKKKYPNCLIYTNYGYKLQDGEIKDWKDLLEIRNDEKGVIFAIDEIQNEWSSEKWKDFPEFLLKEITQQRKQKVKIVATSQVFKRVVKQLREQCFEVVECFTLAGRWTFTKCFDADEYNDIIDSNSREKKQKMVRRWRRSFIQTNDFRELFDSYMKIERIKSTKYLPREARAS